MAPNGPLLLLAGPGSGKTTVLAARIAYLVIARGVRPERVLALAFARRAARELQDRLVGVLGARGRDVAVTTFHAWGLRLIRQHQTGLGYAPGLLAVVDGRDAQRLLVEAVGRLGLDVRPMTTPDLAAQVTRYRLLASLDTLDPVIPRLAARYEATLREHQAVDFAAMLNLPLHLLETCPEVRRAWQAAYDLVLCDEGQDVCPVQYALLKTLVEPRPNLTLVGDPSQTIFGWRGADARALLDFPRNFPSATTLHLHQNFRSTGRIVAAANALSQPLPTHRPVWTAHAKGDIVRLHGAADEGAEARYVADEIERLLAPDGVYQAGDIAILYRTHRQAAVLAMTLRQRGLPYHVRGRGDLLARPEVRDALALLRLVLHPTDPLAHRYPATSGGWLREGNGSWEAMVMALRPVQAAAHHLPPHLLLDLALTQSGYRAWLPDGPESEARLESLTELRHLLQACQADGDDWLTALALGNDELSPASAQAITLSTIHAAKGSEWAVVFVVGLEDGVLPHARSLETEPNGTTGVDEERRLAYVAVTRPRERLYLSWRRTRRSEADSLATQPSRFLKGLPIERA